MLNYLKLENVGPSPKLEIDFKPRMNFLTGDNGLGKTFLLDIAWWVLTRTWARAPATPPRRGWKTPEGTFRGTSSIGYGYEKGSGRVFKNESIFDHVEQYWPLKPGPPCHRWDCDLCARGRRFLGLGSRPQLLEREGPGATGPPAGLPIQGRGSLGRIAAKHNPEKLCNGLVLDWAS